MSTQATDRTGGATFRVIAYGAQFFFAGWFLLHGLNHWFHFFPQPPGSSPIAANLIGAMIASGMFTFVKILEVVTGLMLLANRWVPLAIVLAAPIAIAIAFLDHTANPDWYGTVTAGTIIALLVVMAAGHWRHFRSLFVFDAGEPDASGMAAALSPQKEG